MTTLTNLLSWLFRNYFGGIKSSGTVCSHYISLIERYVRTRGYTWTIKRLKLLRLIVTRYISGSPYHPNETLGLTRDKLPKALGPMKEWIRSGDPDKLRAALTLLNISRWLSGPYPDPDLTPIEEAPKGQTVLPVAPIQRILNDFGICLKPQWKSFHWSTKAGPHGPALWTALSDLQVLPATLKEDIYTLGGSKLQEAISSIESIPSVTLQALIDRLAKRVSQPFRKLSIIKDKEAKTRIIAILDYWSQSALVPLHEELFRNLKKFPADRTFNQGEFKSLLASPGPFYSFDLSSATDRFPMPLQELVLSLLIGEDKAAAWNRILTQWGYTPNWLPDRVVYYSTGQPMGAYSSWAAFTLCHHIVVQYAAIQVNKYPFAEYALLGDDIVIADREVAESYQEVITSLGVDISPAKSHVSHDTFEFAKRWFHKGTEITPFPLGSLIESGGKYTLIAETIRDAFRKGHHPVRGQYHIDLTDPGYCASIFEAFGSHPAFARRLAYKLQRLLLLPRSPNEAVEMVIPFLRLIGIRVPCTIRVATLAKRFEKVAALVKAQELAKEARSLAKLQVK